MFKKDQRYMSSRCLLSMACFWRLRRRVLADSSTRPRRHRRDVFLLLRRRALGTGLDSPLMIMGLELNGDYGYFEIIYTYTEACF